MSPANSSQIERALLGLFAKLDFRDKNNSGKKKFIGILIAYLFSNTLISFNFFSVFDRQSFMILALSSGVFLIVILLLNDFDNLILAGSSYSCISTLPIESSSFFKAKFISAVLFLLPFVLVSTLPQSIFFYFYNESVADFILFFIASFCFAMMTAATLIYLYSIVILKFKDKTLIVTGVIQFLFFIFVFYSSTAGTAKGGIRKPGFEKISVMDTPGINFLPQTLLAKSVDNPIFLFAIILFTGLIFAAGYKFVSANYSKISDNSIEIGKKRRRKKLTFKLPALSRLIDRIYLRNDPERSSFHLVSNQLAGSGFLRMKYIPYIIMPVMFITFGFVFNMKGFLFFDGSSSLSPAFPSFVQLLSPSITIILMMSSRMLVSNTKIMDDITHDTDWIYMMLPVKDRNHFLKGASKSIYIVFLLPVMLLLFAALAIKGGLTDAILNTLYVGSGIYFFNSIASLIDKTMPFTLESGKFNSASKLGEIFLSMGLGVILILIQIFAFQNIIFALSSISIFLFLSFLINRN